MADSEPLRSEPATQALALMRECARLAQLYLAQTAVAEGLGVNDLNALTRIAENDGIAPGVIGKSLPLTTASMTELLDRLERADLIRRGRVATDRRAIALSATSRGKQKITDAYKNLNSALGAVVTDMSDEDLKVTLGFLDRVQMALSEQCTAR